MSARYDVSLLWVFAPPSDIGVLGDELSSAYGK